MHKLRSQEYQKYLDASNKRDLFTDVVSEDYDPMVIRCVATQQCVVLHVQAAYQAALSPTTTPNV